MGIFEKVVEDLVEVSKEEWEVSKEEWEVLGLSSAIRDKLILGGNLSSLELTSLLDVDYLRQTAQSSDICQWSVGLDCEDFRGYLLKYLRYKGVTKVRKELISKQQIPEEVLGDWRDEGFLVCDSRIPELVDFYKDELELMSLPANIRDSLDSGLTIEEAVQVSKIIDRDIDFSIMSGEIYIQDTPSLTLLRNVYKSSSMAKANQGEDYAFQIGYILNFIKYLGIVCVDMKHIAPLGGNLEFMNSLGWQEDLEEMVYVYIGEEDERID